MSARITIDGNLTADPDFGVSTAGTSWARLRVASHERDLPKNMDEHIRAVRVSDVVSVVRENGPDIPVTNDPAPTAAAPVAVPTAEVAASLCPGSGACEWTVAVSTAPVNGVDRRPRQGGPGPGLL